ncbi:MAG: NAD-dependent epimerase/dehydratase family protein, partial [Pseudomonadota bacterium]
SEYLSDALRTGRVRLVQDTISNTALMKDLLKGVDLVVHAAAESHVDNSYKDVRPFLADNIQGTISILDAAVANDVDLFVYISTDEVYGESADRDLSDAEPLNPMNPYAASKASAEMFVRAYTASHGLRTRISRANNIFGTRQYPEKLIPKLICDAISGTDFHVHGQGTAIRSFLHVSDFCEALHHMINYGVDGEVYNVPALSEYTVMDVVGIVCAEMEVEPDSFVRFGPDRPHNDCRYGVCGQKLLGLGWEPTRSLEDGIGELVTWYRDNLDLYFDLQEPEVMEPAIWRFAKAMKGLRKGGSTHPSPTIN